MLSNIKFADKPSWASEPECIASQEAEKSEIGLRRKKNPNKERLFCIENRMESKGNGSLLSHFNFMFLF